ncbi:hypothetical protein BN2497_2409 [Janthinobacterium sp. CG23_2]|nr:hypothetical protein BN2497_2409 [Janthinobacterium sp. CG23_2]CUU27602.1 hypothetical protein BN3177_2409 [Janthinobacterium sp. CG23_2]
MQIAPRQAHLKQGHLTHHGCKGRLFFTLAFYPGMRRQLELFLI